MNLVAFFLICLYSCIAIKNQNSLEYYKRDNLVYADPFVYESVVKLEQDSFVFAEYLDPINAYVYRGIINRNNVNLKLIVNERKAISLNTGQPINITNQESKIEFEITKSNIEEIELIKYQDGNIDSTFRSKPYKPIKKLNALEKWFFDENSSSNTPFWSIGTSNRPTPPKPEMLEREKVLRIEIEKLNEDRQKKLENLIGQIAKKCSITLEDSLVFSLVVKPDGRIKSYNILKSGKSTERKVSCIDEYMMYTQLNLGKMKVVPSARMGINDLTIPYTLLIK